MELDQKYKGNDLRYRIFISGALAGLVVDGSLYPIDTIKSRLQTKVGFTKSGGFSNLYRGLIPILTCSIPNSAIFFITYESCKSKFFRPGENNNLSNIFAACVAEITACTIKIPYEIVKMRSQVWIGSRPNYVSIARDIYLREGIYGLYRGYTTTLVRDIPFSIIQYPIWERLKQYHRNKHKRHPTVCESAYYGSIAGAISAFATTPLDVAKTRIMLIDTPEMRGSRNMWPALKAVYKERGISGCFAGLTPRMTFMSIGAALFLGTYEKSMEFLANHEKL